MNKLPNNTILNEYRMVQNRLRDVFDSDLTIQYWLHAPNILLKNKTPISFIYQLKGHEVLDVIYVGVR